ncbi:MAG: hypothetical protein RLZZ244_1707 [Verrucomicrobiota bacterium]|jgi:hypothetical protein
MAKKRRQRVDARVTQPVNRSAGKGGPAEDALAFGRAKLKCSVAIVVVGLVVSLLFHLWQSKVNGLGYPWNSFLYPSSNSFRKDLQFSDYWDCLQLSASWDPFVKKGSYFPFFYIVFYPLTLIPPAISLVIFFSGTLLACWWLLSRWLRPVCGGSWTSWGAAGALLFGSYPVLMAIDRGNVEVGMFLIVALLAWGYQRKRYRAAAAATVLGASFKLTPLVFLSLFLRRRLWHWTVLSGLGFGLLTLGSLLLFKSSIQESWTMWRSNSAEFTRGYLIYTMGMSWSATLWNPIRAVILFLSAHGGGSEGVIVARLGFALGIYSKAVLLLTPLVAAFVSFVETNLWRRLAILILFMTVTPPPGADYKMIHVILALVGLITLRRRLRFDWGVVVLLSLVLVPKKYWFFPGIVTDSLSQDVSVGIFLNPLLMVIALGLLCADSWMKSTARGRRARFLLLVRGCQRLFLRVRETRLKATNP